MAINQIKERKVKKKINQQMNDFNLIKKKAQFDKLCLKLKKKIKF